MNSKLETVAYNRGYRVAENGDIINPNGKVLSGSIRTPNRKYSQLVFTLKIDGKSKHCGVHRLLAYQKYGDKIYDIRVLVRHLDGNPMNNSYNNIVIGSYSDNYYDIPLEKRENALRLIKSKKYSKYSQSTINSIKQDYSNGATRSQIAYKYNIPINSVYYLIKK